MTVLRILAIAAVGYFVGNIQWGVIISRKCGLEDIRKVGSGGTGATNVLRTIGMKASLFTFLGDLTKGALAALFGQWLLGELGGYIGGVAAIVGHIWPVFYRFKGGKGVATSLGALIAVNPVPGLICLVISFGLIAVLRIVSVVSITMAFAMMVYIFISHHGDIWYMIFGAIIFLLLLYCHRDNIKRLLNGTEKRLNFSKKEKEK